jgi:starch synthase
VSQLNVVTVSSEMVPFAKTGGLGDVCGSLPPALSKLGVNTVGFLPAFRSVLQSGIAVEPTDHTFTIDMAGKHVACRLLKTHLPGSDVVVYLIDQPQYYDRDGLYSDATGDYRDSCERFAFFNRAVVEAIDCLKLPVDILHCHDWQASLMPVYLSTKFQNKAWMEHAKSVMTIHNLAYQGSFWHLDMPLTGLSWDYFNWEQMEFHGELNLLKSGIVFADTITTVSPTYAREITTPEFGCGLESTIASRGGDVIGIVNGVDYSDWNPASDPHLPMQYDISNWREGKAEAKAHIQTEFGLEVRPEVPLVGIVSRMADQKGWDLIIPLLLHWSSQRDVQWVILGTGEKRYEDELRGLASARQGKLGVRIAFSEALAHQIEAASDMFLMPSRYEPCGLNQLYSLKYGAVPVVNATGGLADTVVDSTPETLQALRANGFVCDQYSLATLEKTLDRALQFYLHDQATWGQIVTTGMNEDWSWESSASAYVELFRQLLD